jgi:hypothetical protein
MDCSAERLGWAPAVRRDYIPLAGVAHRGNPVGVGYPGHEVHPGRRCCIVRSRVAATVDPGWSDRQGQLVEGGQDS